MAYKAITVKPSLYCYNFCSYYIEFIHSYKILIQFFFLLNNDPKKNHHTCTYLHIVSNTLAYVVLPALSSRKTSSGLPFSTLSKIISFKFFEDSHKKITLKYKSMNVIILITKHDRIFCSIYCTVLFPKVTKCNL